MACQFFPASQIFSGGNLWREKKKRNKYVYPSTSNRLKWNFSVRDNSLYLLDVDIIVTGAI